MATSEPLSGWSQPARAWHFLLGGRPLVALIVALLTTTGHTMNLRELGVAKGWIAAELYALQSSYLVALSLALLACPYLAQRFSCRGVAEFGLLLLSAGSFLNGLAVHEWLPVFIAGRALAGSGAGLVIYFAPRLLDQRWAFAVPWALILCPVAGPGAVAAASMAHDVSDWEWGFLLEGAAAAVSLMLLLSQEKDNPSPSTAPHGSPAYLFPLALALAALLYCLHWGQLHGWLESFDIVSAFLLAAVASATALWLAWPQLDFLTLRENWLRLLLFFFGGLCMFFHGYTMNVYGGSLINYSSWQRAWLIWPLPIGVAVGLSLWELVWRRMPRRLEMPAAILGLLLLAAGLYLCYQRTMEWPYWQPTNIFDLDWFPAPQHWELAPGRFLMGLGIGLFMMAMNVWVSPDPAREEKIEPLLPVMQFFGGGIAAALLINFLLIGHLVHYSYSADRDYLQAQEIRQRQIDLGDTLRNTGAVAADRTTQALLYRGVRYEADNLVFATIYIVFFAAALVLAGVCGVLSVLWKRRNARGSM
jgi:MFS family permease